MTRVFVSSTCYDLVDLRAEVKNALEAASLQPVMSDDVDNFDVSGRAESIETCLANVRTSEAFVCILSQRYGPSLRQSGYDDVSATHLEYREARTKGLPIYMFVRDRLEGEFSLSQKHRREHNSLDGFQTRWVPKGNYQIFDMLEEHATLQKGASSTNWYTVFTSSVDLKERLQKQLSTFSGRALITRLLDAAALPILSARTVVFRASENAGIILSNVSSIPALDVKVAITTRNDIAQGGLGDLIPGATADVPLVQMGSPLPGQVHVSFVTPAGYRLTQDFALEGNAYTRGVIRFRDRSGFQIA